MDESVEVVNATIGSVIAEPVKEYIQESQEDQGEQQYPQDEMVKTDAKARKLFISNVLNVKS